MTYTVKSGKGDDSDYVPRGGVKDYIYCKKPEVIIEGPAECVAGDTMIYDYGTERKHTIQHLTENNIAPVVETMSGPQQATVPFKKGTDKLYRVLLDNGVSFVASAGHYFFTSCGWLSVGTCLRLLESGASHRRQLLCPSFSDPYERTCKGIELERVDDYYDMSVPGADHYIVDGVVHHNTGKTLGACWKLHLQASKYKGARIVILRKRQTDCYGSVLETYQGVIKGLPIKPYGGLRPGIFTYPNGSKIYIGGIDNPAKVLSSERDIIYVNQAEELTMNDWEYLTTRVTGRGAVMPYTQLLGDCNPAHPQHWILKRQQMGYLHMIQTTHKDNPTLYDDEGNLTKQGLKTLNSLERLTGARKKRLRYGLWAAPEGAIFDVYEDEYGGHKIKSFRIPPEWPRIVCIDPVGAVTAALWLAYDPEDKILHVYREYYEAFGKTTSEHARAILDISKGEWVAGWAGGAKTERQARADWAAAGISMTPPSVTDVWSGIDRIMQLLKEHKILIHDCCINLISELGSYSRKEVSGQFTEVIENKGAYHCIDALRYGIIYLTGDSEEEDQHEVVYAPVTIGHMM